MSSRNILFFDFSLLLCLLLYFGVGVCAGLPAVDCFPNTTSYNVNSTSGRIYRSNLEFLLSVLASNASTHPNGFYNFSVGSVEPLNYTAVYGLFLCRGDVTTSTCQQCLDSAKTEIFRFCPDRSVATLWYDRCMLRDSNQSIFSRLDTTVKLLLNRRVNATDQAMLVVGSLVHKIAIEAAYNVNKFAVGEANFTSSRRIYALGQCTPDLLISDCQTCFKTAIGHLLSSCGAPKGGRVLTPSCNIRYEAYPFYQISSPPPSTKGNGGTSTLRKIVTKVGFIFVAILLFVGGTCLARRLRNEYHPLIQEDGMIELQTRSLQHDFKDIQAATFNFAIGNKIGQGGFGPVYKGALPDGQEIAVKRLSRSSNQGLEEFKNEIKLVSKLQHRNLVRLLGFCKEGEEMVLIYEFVPNKSLNYYLFEKQALLDWSTRYKIIEGIARGILYLHEDSHLKIIHRDLKASNVLLDRNMDPKIADFGMARLIGDDQYEEQTRKKAGTLSYMAPEYLNHGRLSVKSDIFSFGVLVLEIVSGKKKSKFDQERPSGTDDFLSYAWRQWRDKTPLTLVDPSLGYSYANNEVIQSIHVGLLCVKHDAEQRPTISSVLHMLKSLTIPTDHSVAACLVSTVQQLEEPKFQDYHIQDDEGLRKDKDRFFRSILGHMKRKKDLPRCISIY